MLEPRALPWLFGPLLWLASAAFAQNDGEDLDDLDARSSGAAAPVIERMDVPKIRAISFEGRVRDLPGLRALVAGFIGEPATPTRLEALLRAVEADERMGSLDLKLRKAHAGTVEVTVMVARQRQYIDALVVQVDGDKSLGEGILPRLAFDGIGPEIDAGQPWHPYLGRQARESLETWFRSEGYLDAVATLKIDTHGELVTVTLDATRGPQLTVRSVVVEGLPPTVDGSEALARMVVDAPLNPAHVDRAMAELSALLCAVGLPEARLQKRFEREADGVKVKIRVTPGRERRIVSLNIDGATPPLSLRAPVEAGAPFCPATLDAVAARARRWLKRKGSAEPTVAWKVRRVRKGVRVTLVLDGRALGPVHRIWFEGNTVTREAILRQLLALHEGDVPTADAIERSLENLRRSGLVRRASARLAPSDGGDGYYLWIKVREWEFLSVDTRTRRFTLNNLNLTRMPDRFDERGLRGAGQKASVRTDTNDLELTFDDPFLLPHGSGGMLMARRKRSYDFLSESIDSVRLSFGARALQNRLVVLPLIELSQTTRNAPSTYDSLKLRLDENLDVAFGARSALTLSRLDAERINYLGIDLGVDVLGSLYSRPDSAYFRGDANLGFFVPLFAFENGQHLVMRLALEGHWLVAAQRTYAHQRVNVAVRGYTASALRVPYALPDGTEARLGGRAGYLATLDLRIPLPLRRHALIPFGEVGTVGAGLEALPWERLFPAAGLRYFFSLFGERLEGYVETAWGFRPDAPSNLFGVGGGGSF